MAEGRMSYYESKTEELKNQLRGEAAQRQVKHMHTEMYGPMSTQQRRTTYISRSQL